LREGPRDNYISVINFDGKIGNAINRIHLLKLESGRTSTLVPRTRYRHKGHILWDGLRSRVVPTLDVRAALAAVETEAAPAGIVYKTDARMSKRVRMIYEAAGKADIVYSVARVSDSRKREAADFVRLVESREAAGVFTRYGFVVRAAS